MRDQPSRNPSMPPHGMPSVQRRSLGREVAPASRSAGIQGGVEPPHSKALPSGA